MLAVYYACKRSRQAGLDEDTLLDGVLWVTPFTILCARAYYCAFSHSLYKNNPISVLYIWEGGLAIYGGVLGAAIGVALFCKIKKCSLPALLDLVSLGFLIGQSMGCWGNFFNREAFGAATEGFTRMGLYNTVTGVTEYYHPTFLYESGWNLIGFVILHFLSKKKEVRRRNCAGLLRVVWPRQNHDRGTADGQPVLGSLPGQSGTGRRQLYRCHRRSPRAALPPPRPGKAGSQPAGSRGESKGRGGSRPEENPEQP